MSTSPLKVRKVAVLGAGVMGAQIAAHLANADVPVVLFDLPAKEGDPNGIVRKGHRRGWPSSSRRRWRAKERVVAIGAANYGSDLAAARGLRPRDRGDRRANRLEARPVRESRAASRAATRSSRPTRPGCRSPRSSDALPAALRPRFCGIHFFNPPRYMHLVELIAAPATDPARCSTRWKRSSRPTLGKGVIRAKDTPNFIANRIGVFSILATMHPHARSFGLGVRRGRRADRPGDRARRRARPTAPSTSSASTRTAHVIGTMRDTLPDDPWHAPLRGARR